jgi:hypothetical protein
VPCCAVQRSRAGIPTRARRRTTSVVPTRTLSSRNVAFGRRFFWWDSQREEQVMLFCIYICTNSMFTIIFTERELMPEWRIQSSDSMMASKTVGYQRLFILERWTRSSRDTIARERRITCGCRTFKQYAEMSKIIHVLEGSHSFENRKESSTLRRFLQNLKFHHDQYSDISRGKNQHRPTSASYTFPSPL